MLAIGRLIEQKDHATLLRAFARVTTPACPTRGWRFSAGGRSRRETRALANELGLADAVPCRDGVEPSTTGSRAPTCSLTPRAGRGSGSSCSRRCSPACRSSRRASAPCPRSSPTARPGILVRAGRRRGVRGGTRLRSSRTPTARRALGDAGYGRARARVLRRAHGRRDARRSIGERRAVREITLRRARSPAPIPTPDRVALLSIWFQGHNNPRYAELLPRLERLDACLAAAVGPADPARHPVPRFCAGRGGRLPARRLRRSVEALPDC